MTSANQGKFARRDSGIETVNYTKSGNRCTEPYDCGVAGDSATHDSSVDIKYISTYSMKRMLSDEDSGWSEASGSAVKKGRYNRDTTKNSMEQSQRVLCPFFMENPDMDAHRVSCYNKGFNGMSRLKQHLVKEHKVPSKRLGYFKDKSFRDLVSLEAKWIRVYCTLFPNVTEDKVPSPYKTDVSFLQPIATPSISPPATLSMLEDAIIQQGLESGFSSEEVVGPPNKNSRLLANQINSLPTPPSSAETSPELGTLEIGSLLDFESVFPLPATEELSDNNFIDSPLFVDQDITHNDTSRDLSGSSSHSTVQAEHPTIASHACFDCLSTDVFKTTGRGPSIDVCGNCHSTDIEYRLLSDGPKGAPRSIDTYVDPVIPTITAESWLALGNFEHMMAAHEVPDLNMDEWIFPRDSYDMLLGDIENSYKDFDLLFEF